MKSTHSSLISPRRIGATALVAGVLFYGGLHGNISQAQTAPAATQATPQATAPASQGPASAATPATAPAEAPQVAAPATSQTEAQSNTQPSAQAIAPSVTPANTPSTATAGSSTTSNPASFGASYIMQTTLGLLFVLALLMALAWVLKRSGFTAGARSNQFYKILAVNAIGPKEKIALLEVGDTWLLVGMTPGSINTLHSMPKGSLEYDPQSNAAATFAKLLERVKKPNSIQK